MAAEHDDRFDGSTGTRARLARATGLRSQIALLPCAVAIAVVIVASLLSPGVRELAAQEPEADCADGPGPVPAFTGFIALVRFFQTEVDDACEPAPGEASGQAKTGPDESAAGIEEQPAEEADVPPPAIWFPVVPPRNLVLLQWQPPSQLNPLLSTGTRDLLAASLAVEPLAEIAPDGSLVPALAAEIPSVRNGGISADRTQITWKLRNDVVWSDGAPFSSTDVVFTWQHCTALRWCDLPVENVLTVTAVDQHAVTVTFIEPTAYPYALFVSYRSPIIQQAQFRDCLGPATFTCPGNLAPIGTGPYVVTDMRPEDGVSYEKNPRYRGITEGRPYFDTVEILGGGDAELAASAVLQTGDVDFAWNLQLAPEILAGMAARGRGRVASSFTSFVEHINLNQTDPFADPPSEGAPHPLFVDNPDLHRALSIAIDRAELARDYGPGGRATCNIWPVGANASTNNDWCLIQDLAQANALLDGLGYVDTDGDGVREAPGFGPLDFELWASTNSMRQLIQDRVVDYWAQIGVRTSLRDIDASLYFDASCTDYCIWKFPAPMQMFTTGSVTPDASSYLSMFHSEQIPTSQAAWSGRNIARVNDPEVDALIEELALAPVNSRRYDRLANEINDRVVTGALIPLLQRGDVAGFSTALQNTGELNGWDSDYWSIEHWTRTG